MSSLDVPNKLFVVLCSKKILAAAVLNSDLQAVAQKNHSLNGA
jgi:hypothetical protein